MKSLPLLAALALTSTPHLAAQVFSLTPTADAFLVANNPGGNFGGGGGIAVAAAGLSKGEFDSLLRFDLAAAKASFDSLWGAGLWQVQSISLGLTAGQPVHPIFNGSGAGPSGTHVNTAGLFSLEWLANDTWVEGSGTPATPGATGVTFAGRTSLVGASDEALGTFSFNGATTGSTAYALALTPAFTAEVQSGSVVTFLAEPADASIAMLVQSRSNASPPTLRIVTVPEPATAALAIGGLLFLAAGRRRR